MICNFLHLRRSLYCLALLPVHLSSDGFTKKIGSLAKDLHIPMEHIGVLRQALTDRSFSERIYHARREAGNRVETLEPDHHNERLALLGMFC